MKRLLEILLIYVPALFLLLSMSWVLIYKWVPVKWTPLMLKRSIENFHEDGYYNCQVWVDKESVDPVLVSAILLSEDQRFYTHRGFDFIELKKVIDDYRYDGAGLRGCSTISQQVAKNCFTFGGRTYFRKAFEAYYTILIEFLWGKDRILEVYLNVAETGRGLFGVEAACQKYFKSSSEDIYLDEAAALACVLPKPLARTPAMVRSTQAAKVAQYSRQLLVLLEKE